MNDSRIIVALDGMNRDEILALATMLEGRVSGFKLNDAILGYGCGLVRDLSRLGEVMADVKIHDITNTVQNGLVKLIDAGATTVTIHACMGVRKMTAVREFVDKVAQTRQIDLVAITVLTDMTEEECEEIYRSSIQAKVLQFSLMAKEAGLNSIVCSPQELVLLMGNSETRKLNFITPNIRPGHAPVADDDQNPHRKASEVEAIEWGSHRLVIGRAITQSQDPVATVSEINNRVRVALQD